MERVREQRPFCSLSRSQREHRERDGEPERKCRYVSEREDAARDSAAPSCRVPTQKSYSSSETLEAFEHDPARMLFGGRVKEMARQESAAEYSRPGQTFSLRQLGICEPRRGLAQCPERGPSHPLGTYARGPASASQGCEPQSPERTVALWGKGGGNSCLSSRSNSALTLTDTEMDNKSDNEMGDRLSSPQGPPPLPPAPPAPPHKQHPSITSLSRGSLANQRAASPPPAAGLAADLQNTAECVQLQDSWVLGSNVALESRLSGTLD
ncbi:teneurin-3 [Phycodurus eques]|uniref:teneurin-3 n=1 Tax=Phycodurus eques TaxID=693459 RepID=UPI002ACDC700|nr:teneurin-3 [Phycodurus eques]